MIAHHCPKLKPSSLLTEWNIDRIYPQNFRPMFQTVITATNHMICTSRSTVLMFGVLVSIFWPHKLLYYLNLYSLAIEHAGISFHSKSRLGNKHTSWFTSLPVLMIEQVGKRHIWHANLPFFKLHIVNKIPNEQSFIRNVFRFKLFNIEINYKLS